MFRSTGIELRSWKDDMQDRVLNSGALVEGGGGALPVVNPLTGAAVANVAEATPDQVEAATVAAHEDSES